MLGLVSRLDFIPGAFCTFTCSDFLGTLSLVCSSNDQLSRPNRISNLKCVSRFLCIGLIQQIKRKSSHFLNLLLLFFTGKLYRRVPFQVYFGLSLMTILRQCWSPQLPHTQTHHTYLLRLFLITTK